MSFNLKPVSETLLAPYSLVVIRSGSPLQDTQIGELLRSWTGAAKNDLATWPAIAERNKLVFDNERGSIPFDANEVYEGQNRWATILKRGPEHLELSLGIRSVFRNPSQIDIAKDAETIVLKLAGNLRKHLWQKVDVTTEIMINRNNSGIQLSMPPSFRETLFSTDVLKSLVPLGVAVLGGVVSALATQGFAEIIRPLLKALLPAVVIFLVAYLIVALLHWTTSRSDIKWVLGKG
jgi:hypothetical protein